MKQIKKSVNSVEFTTPIAATEGYTLDLQTNTDTVLADGYSSALITCTVRDENGEVYTGRDFTVEFKTNGRGHMSRPETVTTNGVTSNTFISEALDKDEKVTITAQIVRSVIGDDVGEEFKGVDGSCELTLSPEIRNLKYNPVTIAESGYADRVTLRFQENVNDDVYKTNGNLDASKMNVEIWDNIPDTGSLPTTPAKFTVANNKVVNIKEVQGEPKALHVLVDEALTNNRTIGIRVTQVDPETKKPQVYTETFKLTDSRKPQLLSVQADDRRTLRVTFSEAVVTQRLKNLSTERPGGISYAADNASNYSIGTENLASSVWGQQNPESDQVTITAGSGIGNEEDRNVVTIKLGKKADGEYARLAANVKTLLSVSNIGDWASVTSGSNNVMTTDEKEFMVDDDPSAPEIDNVVVQSPEQYLVTFKAPVEVAAAYRRNNPGINVEAKNGDATSDPSATVNQETSVIQLLNENDTNIGNGTDGANPIRVTQIGSDKTQYLIETTRDWTQVYDWSASNNDNYYNHKFRLMIPANALVNINNGVKNAGSITYALTDNHAEMREADLKMPTATDVSWNSTAGNFGEATMTFDEPVKVRLEDRNTGLNDEGLTPSVQQQQNNTYRGVQPATAKFYGAGKEVSGTFVRMGDTQDMKVIVQPNEELDGSVDGVEWRLHITGVDDTYNGFSADKTFKVYSTKNKFRVAWASVSTTDTYDWDRWIGTNQVTNSDESDYWNAADLSVDAAYTSRNGWLPGKDIFVFVKFTDELDKNSTQAMKALNYMFNSTQLSSDVQITAGIKGYDKKTDGTDISGIRDSITIRIPRNSAYLLGENPRATILKITDAVKSRSGESLDNNVEYPLPYGSDLRTNSLGVNQKDSDAVFGDDSEEQSSRLGSGYREAVQNAINSGDYRLIQLSGDITGDLNINEPVDIDLNGNNIYGTVKARFNDGATCHIVDSSGTGKIVSELQIRTPNADWYLGSENVGNTFTCGNVIVYSMPADTLHNSATINKLEVNSGNTSVGIVNEQSGKMPQVVLNNVGKNGTVKLTNNSTANPIGKVSVNSSVKIEARQADGAKGIDEIIVGETAKDVVIASEAKGIVGEVSGKRSTYSITDLKGKPDVDLVGKITLDDAESVKNAIKDAFVSSVDKSSTTTSSAITVGDLIRNAGNTLDKDGGVIEGFTIKAKLSGQEDQTIALDTKKTKVENAGTELWNSVPNGSVISIVIVDSKGTETVVVPSISVTVKKSTT